MQQIFRCDFCDFTDIESLVKNHEAECEYNPNLRICYTCENFASCKHKEIVQNGCSIYRDGIVQAVMIGKRKCKDYKIKKKLEINKNYEKQ